MTKFINLKFKKLEGYSLVEILVYIAILVLMMGVVVNTLILISGSQKVLKSSKSVENSALFSLERIVREIRDAQSVDTVNSSLGVNPGVLVLDGTDSGGNQRTIRFSVSNGAIRISENGVDQGELTQSETTVTSLVFNLINTENSQAVKISMVLESGTSTAFRSDSFYSTAILRGSL